jgi:hypothetical protein
MTNETQRSPTTTWLESSCLAYLFRIPRIGARLNHLGFGIIAVFLTAALGTALDWVWGLGGGIGPDAVSRFILARQTDQEYKEPNGEFGIFQVWQEHQRRALLGFLGSSIPGKTLADGTFVGRYVEAHSGSRPLANLGSLAYGFSWLFSQHYFYALVLAVGLLLIWGWAGGAICRSAALQWARDEIASFQDVERYARSNLFSGYFLAHCVPLGLVVLTAVLMFLGGLLLRVPLVGDLIGGAAFFLAILGGLIIAGLIIGLFTGGHLFWPAVSVEGTDGFDAFSRGFSYICSKPMRAIFYGAFSLVYIAVCWIAANLFVYLGLVVTRLVVGFGTAPFGWLSRRSGEARVNKLELLWSLAGPDAIYQAPPWGTLGVFEYASAVLIGVWVLLTAAAVWAFLASQYFCASTAIYLLLRRDVDGTDIEEVQMEEKPAEAEPQPTAPSIPSGPGPDEKPIGVTEVATSSVSAPTGQ